MYSYSEYNSDMVKLNEKVDELKNIVKVVNSTGTDGMNTVAVDSNGKEYALYEYFE